MAAKLAEKIASIPLEQPASVRRQQMSDEEPGWILPSFLAGPENRSLGYLFDEQQLARLPVLSPIVLYGNKHVGKTCLAVTLAVRWSRLVNLRPLHFTTGKTFVEDYAAAVEIDDLDHFHARHRRSKLLVIDDVEPVFLKNAAQTEFLLTLDARAEVELPVIMSLARLPSVDTGVLPALSSRIAGGYSIEILPPGEDTRADLLKLLVKKIDPHLPIEALLKCCSRHSNSLTATDLLALVTLASQHRKIANQLDLSVLMNIVDQVMTGSVPTLASIAKAVAKRMSIKLTDLRGSTRQSNIVRARSLAILLCRRLTTHSLQRIGQYFGGRDHSTVLHSCRKIDKLLDSDAELAAAKHDIELELLKKRPSLA